MQNVAGDNRCAQYTLHSMIVTITTFLIFDRKKRKMDAFFVVRSECKVKKTNGRHTDVVQL